MKKAKITLSTVLAILMIISSIVAVPITANAKTTAITYSTFKKDYYEDDTKILSVKISIPKLTAKTTAAKKINRYFLKLQKKYIEDNLADSKNKYFNDNWVHECILTSTIRLQYNKNGLYSFKEKHSNFFANCAGMGEQAIRGYTFKKSNGKRITNPHLIKKSGYTNKTFKKAIKKNVCKLSYLGYDKEYVLKNISNVKIGKYGLYYKGNKLYVAIPAYTVSPWVPTLTKLTIKK
ncbi:MAG: hypothetical protein ACI4Q8_07545 [Ruminococcus sp.]